LDTFMFASASAELSQAQIDRINALALHCEDYVSVLVVGRADRRELRSAKARAFASNQGLAQNRGAVVARALSGNPKCRERVTSLSAGPELDGVDTEKLTEAELSSDRSATVLAFRSDR